MLLIRTPESLQRMAAELSGAEHVYLDTEFDAGRDGTRLSLVQLSRGAEVYLVDALELSDLRPLQAVLAPAGPTWVLHAGQQDVALLTARLGLERPRRVFDTQVAWGLVTVEYSASLSYLKYRLLGVRGEKAYQADDWSRRPLPEAQLAYAAEDVVHLPALYRALLAKAAELGRSDAVLEASLESLGTTAEPQPPLSLDAFRNAWQLEREGQAVLRHLVDWYNGLTPAERAGAPDVKGIFSLASRRPKNLDELGGMRAVPRKTVALHGRALLSGIQSAIATAHRREFVSIEPPPYGSVPDLLAQGFLEAIRADVCARLSIAPEIALPSRLMRRMRDTAVSEGSLEAAVGCLAGWRAALLGAEIVRSAGRFGPLSPGLGAPRAEQ